MESKEQLLLATVVNLLTDTFGKRAVLRGGMVLRIIGSARYTNDLDYVFIPYRSKKQIVQPLIACLKTIQNSEVTYSLNSECLRIQLRVESVSIQIEAKVAQTIKTSAASTKLFSEEFGLPKKIIPIVDHSVSLANKLAAWNERRLMRDLYDIWFFLQMNVKPDEEILKLRIKTPRYSTLVRKADYFKGSTLNEFYEFFRAKTSSLTDKDFKKELLDYFTGSEIAGILPLLKASFVKLRAE